MSSKVQIKELAGSLGTKEVTVVTEPITTEEAREMFPYRPYSKHSESCFGGNNMTDDSYLLLNGHAQRCRMCRVTTRIGYLVGWYLS